MEKSVCVVIVTYNRKQYLEVLLKQLVKQTIKIDSILLVDNSSTDGTDIWLRDNGYIKKIEKEQLMKLKNQRYKLLLL